MSDGRERIFSRRHLLSLVPGPVVAAAALGALPALAQTTAQGVLGAPAGVNPGATAPARGAGADLGARVYNVREFGAKGDGTTLDTAAIQSAIDACTGDAGGTVLVPAGKFLIGPIVLKDNVTLHIAAGGTLLATIDPAQYHPAPGIPLQGDHTMGDGNVGLVTGANAVNVTIEGSGTIDGQGEAVRKAGVGGNRRPHLVLFYKCTNLVIRDVYMYHSAYHTCRICNSDYVHLDGIRINCRTVGNNDGFHFISARYVNMTNCNVRSQDDACALFGSCQFITVTNCSFSTRWSVFRFGGGLANNIAVSNCLIYQVFGCPIKLRCEPGSVYENMSFSNLVFQDVTGPISIGAGPQSAGGGRGRKGRTAQADQATSGTAATAPAATPGTAAEVGHAIVRNISFSNITGNVVTKPTHLDEGTSNGNPTMGGTNEGEQRSAIIVNCVEGNLIENISFSDIRLTFGGGGTAKDAAKRKLSNIAGEYFALGPIPAYGFYSRNARGISLNNVRFQVATPELRPAVMLDGVKDATISGLSAEANPQAESVMLFVNASDTLVTAPRVLTPAAVFLRVEGSESKAITVDGGDISKAANPLEVAAGAVENAVKMR